MKNLKLQWIDKIPPLEERNPELFYYDLRDSEIDNGYTVERGVLVNNIGSLVTNKDILEGIFENGTVKEAKLVLGRYNGPLWINAFVFKGTVDYVG